MGIEELSIIRIEGGIRAINAGTKSPQEAAIGTLLNKLKTLNEGMYDDLIEKYKKAVDAYKLREEKKTQK